MRSGPTHCTTCSTKGRRPAGVQVVQFASVIIADSLTATFDAARRTTLLIVAYSTLRSRHHSRWRRCGGRCCTGICSQIVGGELEHARQTWVDDLYFIFRESIGQRLTGLIPPSFQDVNDIRTALQRDVDHGKGSGAKRKKLGASLNKYVGVTTADAIAPEQFQLLQANLLGALVTDLRSLSKTIL
jgi:hypothetical protein